MDKEQASGIKGYTPALSEADFHRFGQLLLRKYGLNFTEIRRSELEAAVTQSFASSTFSYLDDYYNFLNEERDGGAELERLVNIATVNETHFFRDAGQFDALRTQVFPELIRRRQSMHTLRIWSAGCSSGEEPYSLAILLHELLPDLNDWSITILATDINTNALDRARKAVYSTWSFREEQAKLLRDRYFSPSGNRWELRPDIRRMVTFTRMNLAVANYPSYETNTNFIDLLICRNVLIYLGEEVTRAIIARFFECIQPGGWLVVAPAEGSPEFFKQFKARSFPSAVLYQRLTQTAMLRLEKPLRPTPPAATSASISPPTIPVRSQVPRTGPIQAPNVPSLSPSEEQEIFDQAQEMISFGHQERALELLQKLVNSISLNDKVCALIGQIYANRGDWDRAESWCSQAIRQNKLSLDAYYTLALVMQHKNQLDYAVEAMRKVVYLDHTDVLGHFGLANLYYDSGQYSKAIKSLDNALRLLENRSNDEIVARSGGITVTRLRDAIIRQQQLWNGLSLDLPNL